MFKLNTKRSYQQPVSLTIYDEQGKEQTGRFTATFKVMPYDQVKEQPEDVTLLDAVLVSVSDIEVPGENGEMLTGGALLDAVKNDPAASVALISAYHESITKKNRPRT
ncbi:hypothetical protein QO259_10430 [Salinicola sp. JS01]|uniref:hypothetical protein n=1 Tax=Salinicola sp. JS01 TaxID=3050071 RepID=UPI00255BB1DE|nr:hypothetical protein [Salinicola sp. JS01]WIX31251.1 hypothetical protein QO259_10430 [Salinicola sp. JS01]